MTAAPPPIPAGDTFLPCPACGYDLRGAPTDRCPECGVAIDAEALRVSAIPWAHRRQIGRIRAYVRTVRQVAFGSAALTLEPARPQDPRDARAFHRVTGTIVAMAHLGLLALGLWVGDEGFAALAVDSPDPFRRALGRTELPAWTQDLYIPWSAGATMRPVIPLCLMFLAFHLTGVQHIVLRLPATAPIDQRRRARALSAYAAAPLVLLAFLPTLLYALLLLNKHAEAVHPDLSVVRPLRLGVALSGVTLVLYAVVATAVRVSRWLARSRHCGVARSLVGLLELAAWWLLGVIVFLGVLPWSTGFGWIVIDSLR